jgi:hypothetical protein
MNYEECAQDFGVETVPSDNRAEGGRMTRRWILGKKVARMEWSISYSVFVA